MAHFAKLGVGNKIERVIVIHNNDAPTEEAGQAFIKTLYPNDNSLWLQTSFNTKHGEHLLGGTPLRMNFAEAGGYYNQDLDAFIPPQYHGSWVFDETICDWVAPVEMPDDGQPYDWSEDQRKWVVRDIL